MVYIPVNATWVGQTVWVGAAVAIGTRQIWAGELGFNVTNTSLADVVSYSVLYYCLSACLHYNFFFLLL